MSRTIRMIGLDLDGTLLNSKKQLSDYTRQVLERAIAQGVIVLAATGRPLSALPKEILEFPGMHYAVSANGARILKDGKTIAESLVPVETASKVIDILRKYHGMHEIFVDGIGFMNEDGLRVVDTYFEDQHMANYVRQTRRPVKDVKATLYEKNQPVDKLQGIFKTKEDKAGAWAELRQLEGVVATDAMVNNLEINRAGTNKGLALLKLGEMLGIEKDEIMACGDGRNDYDMLQAVGFAVAMENGCDCVKEIADYIAESNDEDGVAKTIERFVLKE